MPKIIIFLIVIPRGIQWTSNKCKSNNVVSLYDYFYYPVRGGREQVAAHPQLCQLWPGSVPFHIVSPVGNTPEQRCVLRCNLSISSGRLSASRPSASWHKPSVHLLRPLAPLRPQSLPLLFAASVAGPHARGDPRLRAHLFIIFAIAP